MGEVYRARDTKLERDVALKVLPAGVAADGERLARFRREAHLLAALNHAHIAQVHGFEDSTGVHALVMELVEGATLADRLASGPLPLEDARAIGRQIAEALEAAHEKGIIHRDLKPAKHQGCRRRHGQGPGFRPRQSAGFVVFIREQRVEFADVDRPRH
jgi:eukaryotic-like serine/threonine-protein kinase